VRPFFIPGILGAAMLTLTVLLVRESSRFFGDGIEGFVYGAMVEIVGLLAVEALYFTDFETGWLFRNVIIGHEKRRCVRTGLC